MTRLRPLFARALGALVLLAALGPPARAADAPAVDPALLRGLMGQLAPKGDPMEFLRAEAAKVAACMQKVDAQELALVQASAERAAKQVRELCAANRRGEAQQAAQSSASDLLAAPVVGQLQECDPLLGDLQGLLPWLGTSARYNVCDLEKAVSLPAATP